MRYLAPPRGSIDPAVFARPPLLEWQEYAELLQGAAWPSLEQLAARLPDDSPQRFVAQTPQLLADGLHYEQRIAQHGAIATRLGNWHDLFNALIWLRYPAIKRALNAQQVTEITLVGTKQRSRAQCAQQYTISSTAMPCPMTRQWQCAQVGAMSWMAHSKQSYVALWPLRTISNECT
jgi:hypothetical protein